MILLYKQTRGFSYRISKTTFCKLLFFAMPVLKKISSKLLSFKSNTALSTTGQINYDSKVYLEVRNMARFYQIGGKPKKEKKN